MCLSKTEVNECMIDMNSDELSRESVIKKVIEIFIDVIGSLSDDEKLLVNENTDIIKDFNVAGDDATEVDMALEKHFEIKLTIDEWGQAVRIHEIVDVILKKLNNKYK